MFSFFKGQENNKKYEEEDNGQEQEEIRTEARINQEIAIHMMPERFRLNGVKVDEAKTTGVFIMVAGFIFIIIIGVLFYFFVFKSSKNQVISPVDTENFEIKNEEAVAPTEDQNGEEAAEETPPVIIDDSLDDLSPAATTTPEEEVDIIATSTPSEIEILDNTDIDSDGLTAQEELLLGSDDNSVDSDGDGYLDYDELKSLYNPVGTGKIIDNVNIGQYKNETFAYSILYPLSWTRTSVGGNDSIIFKSENNDFIQVIAQANIAKQSIEDWYKEQFEVEAIDPARKLSGHKWLAVKSEDDSVVYLADDYKNYIFALSHSSDTEGIFAYKNIFDLMVKSLEIAE